MQVRVSVYDREISCVRAVSVFLAHPALAIRGPDPREQPMRAAWERLARRARMPGEAPEVSRTMSGSELALPLDLPLRRVNLVFRLVVPAKPTLRVTCGGGACGVPFGHKPTVLAC